MNVDNALKESEQRQRQLVKQLAETNRDLEQRVRDQSARLEAAGHELATLSYAVAHDLRAPLRHVDGFSRILAEDFGGSIDPEGREVLARIRSSVARMNALIEGMLTVARLGRQELRVESVNLTSMAGETAAALRNREPQREAEFVIHPDLRATGDPLLLRTVIEHLIGNAWKATARRARTRIEFGRAAETHGPSAFFVTDNGVGFDMRCADRLFGLFQRLHAEEEFPGVGVGLAAVKRIIARHDGRTWVTAAPDEGASFFFEVPDAL